MYEFSQQADQISIKEIENIKEIPVKAIHFVIC